MKLSRCVIIYCTHLLGLQATRRRWVSEKDRGAVAASINTHHANSTQWFMESLPRAGDKWPSHILIRGRHHWTGIPVSQPSLPPGPPSRLSVFVCVQVCICVLLSKTDTEPVLEAGGHCWLHSMRLSLWECQIKCLCCDISESLHSQHDVEGWLALQMSPAMKNSSKSNHSNTVCSL